jgi:hypothetical protein
MAQEKEGAMSEPESGNSEVLASAVSVPINIINGLADLLISKGIISRDEMVSLVQRLVDLSPQHGENEPMVKMMLAGILRRFQSRPPQGSSH